MISASGIASAFIIRKAAGYFNRLINPKGLKNNPVAQNTVIRFCMDGLRQVGEQKNFSLRFIVSLSRLHSNPEVVKTAFQTAKSPERGGHPSFGGIGCFLQYITGLFFGHIFFLFGIVPLDNR